jgi:hypothetical protein
MVSRLVVIGDSFCHGVGTASPFKDTQNTHWSVGRYLADYYEIDYVNLAEPGINFSNVMPALDRHPTQDEQKKFAELWISKYGKK